VSDNSTNKHRAINIVSLSDKDIKKYRSIKADDLFIKDDCILLYDDQYVKVTESSKLLKYKVTKDVTAYRKK